ncbi:beta-ketoacyl-ACP synthase [Colwellia sp. D2M02]|uniref:beta-ketoacyl-ACP synthase n=1 Tax=Colwellia sp. D2M02 TaxID=2841562 RepID=UPI001C09FFAE|nr:beta-ketoacyl-ACP synthase [Colwellia sp. D2M02]MBU2892010.1 beta-ketoacyl-ACP synthase [Colwellia sp. D2M02]
MATFLHDLGINCALGNNKAQVLTAIQRQDHSTEFLSQRDDLHLDGTPVFVGEVNAELPCLSAYPSHFNSRNNQLALQAFQQIAHTFTQLTGNIDKQRIAVVIGTSTSGILSGERARSQLLANGNIPKDYHYATQEMAAPAQFIAHVCGAQGPVYSISTACSSSAKSLATAKMLLESNIADVVLCGGVDALSQLTINGFSALESVSAGLCNPFGAERDGINIGEAAALFLMSRNNDSINLCSAGESSDAYHISAPHPEGDGAYQSMALALKGANLSASDIDYINLHGTGTPKNDDMEAKAVHRLFGSSVLASSTKRYTGHTLGAAGALEAGLCWLLLQNQSENHTLPSNVNNGKIDPSLAAINLVDDNTTKKVRYCLSNSYAFGGNNISLILGKNSA